MGTERPARRPPVESLRDHVRYLLRALGEDPARPGLRKTPERVEAALRALTRGYGADPDELVNGAIYPSDCDEMILVRDIELYSLCEHHLLPFFGRAHVAYLPAGRILGLSKIARLVDCFARRLQVQEQLTMQIARTIRDKLRPRGVAVVIEAAHLCLMIRGVEKQNALCVTSAMLGRFKTDSRTRQEFLTLIRPRHP